MGIDVEDIVTAAVIVIVMTIGMRWMYGYWPWQRRYSKVEIMQKDVAATFRESPPPYKPFSEADEVESHDDKERPQRGITESMANKKTDENGENGHH